ncbi:MAG: cation diffusion facilitator family transporter [Paracoccaceae bacterium]
MTTFRKRPDPSDAGKSTIYAALVANTGIAITKFIAAAMSGSSAMMSEGIHSTIDTANEGFLLLGLARAKKPADEKHPFGYRGEIFFWSFIVAVLIFALGAGLSIYEGVRALRHGGHEASGVPWIPLGVLAVSLLFEGYSLSIAIRHFTRIRKGNGLLRDVQDLKDPSIFVILAEDSAACLGLGIAAIGVTMSWLTGSPAWDASASIAIGGVLALTAVFLAIEVKGLMIGESTDPDIVQAIRDDIESLPEILTINEFRTLHLGPHDVLLTLSIDFADDVPSQRIEAVVTAIEQRIKARFPIVRHVFLEVQSTAGHSKMVRLAAEG